MILAEVKPGMLIKDRGLVVEVRPLEKERTNFSYYCLQGAHDGVGSCWTGEGDNFEILYEKGTDEYKKIVARIKEEVREAHEYLGTCLEEIDNLSEGE